MLQAEHIHFAYPSQAELITDLSLQIEPSEILGIIGPNGAGKTTLMHVMAGLLTPQQGRILINQQNLHQLPRQQVAQELALVTQQDQLNLPFTVWDIVLMGRQPYQSLFSFDSAEDIQQAEQAIAATELEALRTRSIQELSGGERRRVLIARALAQNTPTLLLDEPTASLDLHFQLEICELLSRLKTQQGRTIVMTIHDMNLAALYCDRILLLADTKEHFIGTPQEVLTAEKIQQVFRVPVNVTQDTESGRPYCQLIR